MIYFPCQNVFSQSNTDVYKRERKRRRSKSDRHAEGWVQLNAHGLGISSNLVFVLLIPLPVLWVSSFSARLCSTDLFIWTLCTIPLRVWHVFVVDKFSFATFLGYEVIHLFNDMASIHWHYPCMRHFRGSQSLASTKCLHSFTSLMGCLTTLLLFCCTFSSPSTSKQKKMLNTSRPQRKTFYFCSHIQRRRKIFLLAMS